MRQFGRVNSSLRLDFSSFLQLLLSLLVLLHYVFTKYTDVPIVWRVISEFDVIAEQELIGRDTLPDFAFNPLLELNLPVHIIATLII